MSLLSLPLVLALSTGCTPQNADATGSFRAILAASTSRTLFNGSIDLDSKDWTDRKTIDCRDPEQYTVLEGADTSICDSELWPPKDEGWLSYDGYQVVAGDLDPWRGEAIITSEGDLQLTFHNHLPGGSDMRFSVVVDPSFQPKSCQLDDSGNASMQDVDGEWLKSWSDPQYLREVPADEDYSTGTLFFINAGSYQFNPSNLDDIWVLPEEWLAGFSIAKFADEDFYLRTVRYGKPTAYAQYQLDSSATVSASDLFYVPEADSYDAMITEADDIAKASHDELALTGADYTPLVETNQWRPVDDTAAGLDNWVELDYNWIHLDQDASEVAVGSPVSGTFHLFYEAADSQSRMILDGTFTVDKVKKDHWTVEDLHGDKLKESGTTICGQTADEASQ